MWARNEICYVSHCLQISSTKLIKHSFVLVLLKKYSLVLLYIFVIWIVLAIDFYSSCFEIVFIWISIIFTVLCSIFCFSNENKRLYYLAKYGRKLNASRTVSRYQILNEGYSKSSKKFKVLYVALSFIFSKINVESLRCRWCTWLETLRKPFPWTWKVDKVRS